MSLSGGEDKEMRPRISDPNSSKPKPANPRVSYRECLKNHAANIGGNVTDGCGEFMPGGEEGTLEALNCAACSCHRNFHRKEHHQHGVGSAMVHPLQLTPPLPSPALSHHRGGAQWSGSAMQPVRMAFGGGGGGGDSSSEELNFSAFHLNAVAPPPPQKRFRTKFTAAQKEKMLEFAEKVGWRIPREDDAEMQRFCVETGVKRQVFKVWMHNNKTISSNKTTPIFPNVN
ncbi:zinc-finger homeodomain protein 5-like [Salvia divinorum]|uniref:Zinc-finger homeodomain protein 5-like n=1 Tax=Salvia divinorum TaxID=28513 RepID=A0ABD1FSM3_SALDI